MDYEILSFDQKEIKGKQKEEIQKKLDKIHSIYINSVLELSKEYHFIPYNVLVAQSEFTNYAVIEWLKKMDEEINNDDVAMRDKNDNEVLDDGE